MNNFAISSAGVGEALLNSAASLAAAGNNIHESVALIAAANTTIQDPGRVGTALKTLSMYLRAAKTEAEEAGIDTDGMAESVSQLREEILRLTGGEVDLMLNADTGEYKNTVQILRELSGVWDRLSDTSKTNITEMIGGGVRNANIISALMNNFSIVEDVLDTSMQSTGSALAENEKYLDSIVGKSAQVRASFESLSSAFMDTNMIKGFYDTVNVGLQGLTGIVNFLDMLSPVIMPLLAGSVISKGADVFGDLVGTAEKLKNIGGPVTSILSKMFESLANFKFAGGAK